MDDNVDTIGFMFDQEHEKTSLTISLIEGCSVVVKTIGENPGHKQSGQYIWPASKALANYLLLEANNFLPPTTWIMIELGAGCGVAGISAARFVPSLRHVIFTDYDPGALILLEENMVLNEITNGKALWLEWGKDSTELCELISDKKTENNNPSNLLIIGADLIYCKDVVAHLLNTVQTLLRYHNNNNSNSHDYESNHQFLLATSFDLGEVSCREYTFTPQTDD
jgi:predicted nicotinamide N-methyase